MTYYIKRRYKYPLIIIDVIGSFFVSIKKVFVRPKILQKSKVKNIILLVLDLIGDGILATPAIKNVRENFPNAKITVVVGPWNENIFKNNPNIDELKTINSFWARSNDLGFWKQLKTFLGIYFQTEKENYDLGIDLRGEFLSILLLRKMGVKYRVGYGITGGGWMLDNCVEYKGDRFAKHAVKRNFDLLKAIDLNVNYNLGLEVYPNEKNKDVVDEFLQENDINKNDKIIVIHPCSNDQARCWDDEKWVEVIGWLLKNEYKVIISGGKTDENEVLRIKNEVYEKISLLETDNSQDRSDIHLAMFLGYSILDLAELMGRVGMVVCVNSAPLHIAAAQDVPIVVLFAGSYPRTYGPWPSQGGSKQNDKSVVLFKNVDCFPCGRSVCKNNVCMQDIRVEEVVEAIKSVMCVV